MKVGVFLEDFSPEVGGGYTIQEDIFRALLDLIDETSHSFVLFCRRPESFRSFLTNNAFRSRRLSRQPGPTRFRARAKRAQLADRE